MVKPIKVKLGPIIPDQAQWAKPNKAQDEFINNLERLIERIPWEVGKGSWSHASAEKVPKLSPSTGELAEDLSRADGCVDEVLTCDFSVGP